MKESYTFEEIKAFWKSYNSKKVLRRLKAGKWEFMDLKGQGIPRLDNATRAEIVSIRKEMGFPEFVKRYGN